MKEKGLNASIFASFPPAAFSVPFFLFPPVGLYISGMLRPIVLPIVGVLFDPVLLGIPMVGLVVRVLANLFPLPLSFAGLLAFRSTTILLVLDPGFGKKKIGNADIVSEPWLPSRRNHKSGSGSLKRRKLKNGGWSGKKKEENRLLAAFYSGAPGLLLNRSKW